MTERTPGNQGEQIQMVGRTRLTTKIDGAKRTVDARGGDMASVVTHWDHDIEQDLRYVHTTFDTESDRVDIRIVARTDYGQHETHVRLPAEVLQAVMNQLFEQTEE